MDSRRLVEHRDRCGATALPIEPRFNVPFPTLGGKQFWSDGDDDGFVALAETRLPGAADFLVVASPHGLVDQHPATICAVRAFLKHGRFGSPRC